MILSEDQYQVLGGALGCKDGDRSAENGGQWRVPKGARATIIPCDAPTRREPRTVGVLNVSEEGMGILAAERIGPGGTFILHLPANGNRPAMAILCSVLRLNPFPNGMFAIGARFVRVLSVRQAQNQGLEPAAQQEGIEDQPVDDLAHVRLVEERLSQLTLQ